LSPLVAVSKEDQARIKRIQTIAVLLTGNDALLSRFAVDALNIHLKRGGFKVINREKLEKSVGEELIKKKIEAAEGAISAIDIGRKVNADGIVTGTVFIASDDQQSLLVKMASFQLVEVKSGKTLISVLFELEKGKSFSNITKKFVDILQQNRR